MKIEKKNNCILFLFQGVISSQTRCVHLSTMTSTIWHTIVSHSAFISAEPLESERLLLQAV
jgi:hypothetical protein